MSLNKSDICYRISYLVSLWKPIRVTVLQYWWRWAVSLGICDVCWELNPNGLSVAIKVTVNSRIIAIEMLSISLKRLLISSQHRGGFSRPTNCHGHPVIRDMGHTTDCNPVHRGSTELPAWSCVGGQHSQTWPASLVCVGNVIGWQFSCTCQPYSIVWGACLLDSVQPFTAPPTPS